MLSRLPIGTALLVVAFASATTLPAYSQPREFQNHAFGTLGTRNDLTASASIGDVNSDGHLDVVVANGRHWAQGNEVFFNNGSGRFNLMRALGAESTTSYAVPLGDLDGDGDLDVAVGNDRTRNMLFRNEGGSFVAVGPFGGNDNPTRSITLADVDGDTDILVGNVRARNAAFFNLGGRSGFATVAFGLDDGISYDVAAGDVNGDVYPDVVVANSGGPNVVYLNRESRAQ